MKSISKRIIVLVVLLSLLISSVPVPKEDTNSVHASSLTTAVTNPSESINASYGATVLINEVMFNPSEGNYEWLELKNVGPGSIDIRGYSLTDEDDNWYEIPDNLPPVPEGAFVVVVFDGLGASFDDYEFSDNVAFLHSEAGLVNIFEDDFDQASLYAMTHHVFLAVISTNISSINNQSEPFSSNILALPEQPIFIKAFVAWGGDPLGDDSYAVQNGIWFDSDFVNYSSTPSDDAAVIYPDESIGLYPGVDDSSLLNWSIFIDPFQSLGNENPVPSILSFFPGPGESMESETFSIKWNNVYNAIGYHFQMDDGTDFVIPIVDQILNGPAFVAPAPIPAGRYNWRVKVLFSDGKESAWSLPNEVFSTSGSLSPITSELNTLEIDWQLQRKDTKMLCLFGGNELGVYAWDKPHQDHDSFKNHGANYCSRATISMIASFYGAELSQDRIAYEDYKDTNICSKGICDQLGHYEINNLGISDLFNTVGLTGISWISAPDFAYIKDWIDELRPLAVWSSRYGRDFVSGLHFLVIDGYKIVEENGQQIEKVHLLDPWDRDNWVPYNQYRSYIKKLGVTPAYTPINILQDEDDNGNNIPDTMEDEDGDGICNFDENHRFFTNPNLVDTDGDGVNDRQDLREYVFDNSGIWNSNNLQNPDIDHDGLRKELDWDNDDDGSWDGCEDFNQDGIYEKDLGESNNFSVTDKAICYSNNFPGNSGPLNTGVYVNQDDYIQIKASGEIYNGLVYFSPDGGLEPPDLEYGEPILPNLATNCLVGSIGVFSSGYLLDDGLDINPSGISGSELGFPGLFGPGYVGSLFRGNAQANGYIYFAFNDYPLRDNTGSFSIRISVH